MIKPTSPGIVPAAVTRSRTVSAMAAFPALFPATFALKSAQAPPSTWRSAPLIKLAASDANECDRVGDLLRPASLACQVEYDRQEMRKDGSCRRPAQQPAPAGPFPNGRARAYRSDCFTSSQSRSSSAKASAESWMPLSAASVSIARNL